MQSSHLSEKEGKLQK